MITIFRNVALVLVDSEFASSELLAGVGEVGCMGLDQDEGE